MTNQAIDPAVVNAIPPGGNNPPPDAVVEPVPLHLTEDPAPAQSAKVVPEPPKEGHVNGEDGGVVEYSPTGDPGLDVALSFLGGLGIGSDSPGMVAAQSGDFSILQAELAALGDKAKGWEKYVALGQSSYAKTVEANKARAEKDRADIEAAVGGGANWAAIQQWASKAADPGEKEAVNKALAAGGVVAKAVAEMLANRYHKAAGTRPPTAAAFDPATATPVAVSGALSPQEYTEQVAKLYDKLGGQLDGSREYADLRRRRASFRQ